MHVRTGQLPLAVNTHWHADHVGGNAMLQARGRDRRQPPRRRRGSPPRPSLLPGRVPRQPVTPYTVDEQFHDSQILSLGDAEWQVICTPGHTPGPPVPVAARRDHASLLLTATYPASLLVFGSDLGHAHHPPPSAAVPPWLHCLESRIGADAAAAIMTTQTSGLLLP